MKSEWKRLMSAYKYIYICIVAWFDKCLWIPSYTHIQTCESSYKYSERVYILRNEENKDDDHVIHQIRIFF